MHLGWGHECVLLTAVPGTPDHSSLGKCQPILCP